MRGLAVVIMIQCHVFNSFARMDVREGGPYVLSQFIGGMAAPLFLFMAGMTFAFQLDSLERREPSPWRRWRISLRRAAYILGIAFLFRFTNWVASLPHANVDEITKVDILNCMGVGMAAVSLAALFGFKGRVRFAVLAGLAIAAAAPIMTNLPWGGTPAHRPGIPRARSRPPAIPVLPVRVLRRVRPGRRRHREAHGRGPRWTASCSGPRSSGFVLVFTAQYFSNIPYSVYPKSDFWRDSPALILIRVGIMLLMMAGAYLWTEFCMGTTWSWMLCFGKTSLMVYWVHVMLVYGDVAKPLQTRAIDSRNRAGDAPGDAVDGGAGRPVAMVEGAPDGRAGASACQPNLRSIVVLAVPVPDSQLLVPGCPMETPCKTPSMASCASAQTPCAGHASWRPQAWSEVRHRLRRTGPSMACTTFSIDAPRLASGSSKPPVLPRCEITNPARVRLCSTFERNCSGHSAARASSPRLARVPGGSPAK